MITNDKSKCSKKFYCIQCDYYTSRLSQFNRHLLTAKHKMIINDNNIVPDKNLQCKCGKIYKYMSGLSRHKKQCNQKMELSEPNLELTLLSENNEEFPIISQELIIEMVKKQQDQIFELTHDLKEAHKTITDLIPKIGNHNTTNNVKQRFNINVFLNEKCKDAISMDQFIEKIEISMKNLLTTKDKGLSEGITNIIIDNMNKLSLYERPMHCTDKKRETLYIKNDEWEKDERKELINNLLKKVEHKQMKNIKQWTDKHPNYMEDDKLQDEYINLVRKCTSSVEECKEKVIKKVCDNVYLEDKE